MGRPDALSRQAGHPKGVDDNADFTLLTLEVFKLRAMRPSPWKVKRLSSQNESDRVLSLMTLW